MEFLSVRSLRHKLLARCMAAVAAIILLAGVLPGGHTSAALPNEYALKSVFLYNFCRFIDWPGAAFAGPDDPIVIGIFGEDPFGPLLNEAVQGETFHGRGIRIEYYRNPRDVTRCHLLFVSGSETPRVGDVLAAVAGRSIVTVGETESFLERGGMISLVADRNRIRLLVNPEPLRAAKVDVSSKLLRVAEITR
ncbi:MAG: YfiR family protein [Verrucomicrobiaceae bacterium]|nr:YfiR family protein [Verrucomicrobiaceae bacterium]